MPGPTENGIRLEIVKRHEKGESLRSISDELHLSYETVKKIWRHWQAKGAIEPNYEQAKQRGTRHYREAQALVLEMKRQHPRWGAQLIWLEIRQAQPHMTLPSIRTMQRWFIAAGINRSSQVKQQRAMTVKRGEHVHEVWAVDAKENILLADGNRVSWLIISDEASGAILQSEIFPPSELGTGEG
jgi:hypothetical protein